MDFVMGIVHWVQANWVQIGIWYTSAVGIASIVVKLTPTLADDTFLLNLVKFVAKYIALNVNAPKDADRPE